MGGETAAGGRKALWAVDEGEGPLTAYLLDSSVIIDALRPKRGRDLLLEHLLLEGHSLACCAINVTEGFAGLRPKEEATTVEFLQSLEYREVTWNIARNAGFLKREWTAKGLTLALADVTIAAVALAYDLVLITDNVRHYPMPELRLYQLPKTAM